ncbi:lysozyme [Alcaligenes sp. A-TC2]|uniref:lysozyme n=1 Tax=Alcaligenes nematophilus TaxID=2994643 RepID=UPI0022510296|nr:lysozyme [Alcaligenes nematophilus]MCX5470461.1 lysozyme [Alcaligenes nematophilus]
MKLLLSLISGLLALFFRPQKVEQATPEPEKAAPTGMSPDGLAILQYFESCRLEAYWDADGKVWTIGWGDTGPDVVKGLRITQAEADERLQRRLAREFVPGVLKALTRPATQAQIDAMVDLAYNIGVSAFQGSMLVRLFNAGDAAGAAEQFSRWNKSNGKVLLGLRRRRAADRMRFQGSSGNEAIRVGAAIV